jgi:hypothetical protein
MQDDDLVIGGLAVPLALTSWVLAGQWIPPSGEKTYVDVFGDRPEQPTFYDIHDLVRQNSSWQSLGVDDVFGRERPGESMGIEPDESIVIADLGPDMPIVLDYRESKTSPRVLYLTFDRSPIWIQVASSVEELLSLLYGAG